VSAGQPVHHFTSIAHTGEMVNICEFAGQRMMIDLSAEWCGPCHSAAACIAGNDTECGNLFSGGFTAQVESMVNGIRGNLQDGSVNWVTVLYETQVGGVPQLSNLQAWESAYPQNNVWVMSDSDEISGSWLPTSGIPFFVSVETDFTYLSVNNGYEWGDLSQ
jgi:hypothetical protein